MNARGIESVRVRGRGVSGLRLAGRCEGWGVGGAHHNCAVKVLLSSCPSKVWSSSTVSSVNGFKTTGESRSSNAPALLSCNTGPALIAVLTLRVRAHSD
jgi:hypothetical protein